MYQSVPIPHTWAVKSYNNKPYYLVEISVNSTEYDKIENHFDGYDVIKIERVQNPYQLGKYQLYKLQKNSFTENTYFMPLKNSEQLDLALRFNCDYRRLNYPQDMFFPSVSAAVLYSSSYGKIIVLQGLGNYTNHDSGRYPKYVVTYQSQN